MSTARRVLGRWLGTTAAALALVAGVGCSSSGPYPAKGKVTFKDGTPLKGGWVVFEPKAAGAKAGARSDIQPDGTFHLGTVKEGDGAFEGDYRVAVVPPLPPGSQEGKRLPPLIQLRYQNPETSGLEFTVTRDPHKNDFAIVVAKP